MSELPKTISELPWDKLIPVGLLFICGLLLWVAGRRVLRTGFAGAGLLLGLILGWALGETADLGVEPWIAGATGAVIFTIVATLAYRLALAAAVGGLMAILAPMGVWTADERQLVSFSVSPAAPEGAQPVLATPGPGGSEAAPLPQVEPGAPGDTPGGSEDVKVTELETWLEGRIQSAEAGPEPEPAPSGNAQPAAEPGGEASPDQEAKVTLARPFQVAAQLAGDAWEQSPSALRGSLIAAGAFGAMVGFVLGALAPTFSAILVSSLGGAFLLLTTGWVLAAGLGIARDAEFTSSVTVWTAVWLALSVLGLCIQWILRPRAKAAPEQ